ncbi:Kinesin-like protein kif24 [Globomyces sp. JEL0801]|nr:Kinesin-like protein kif24 [Globomyces sp. JEL0801]
MASLFLETLRQAELDAYYSSLTAYGVRSVEALMQLSMQDYGVVGVHSMEDRKTDFPSGDKKQLPVRRVQAMSLSQQSLGSSSSSLGRASISDTHSGSYPNSQSNSQSNLYEKSQSNKSIMQDSDEEDENLVPFKKVGKPNLSSSPKQTRSNLNAYGVPMSSVSTTQKPSSKGDLTDRIRVCRFFFLNLTKFEGVRKRPLSKKEARKGEQDIARIIGRRTIHVLEPKVKVDLTKYVENHEFVFDEAFDANASNEEVYRRTAQPLVQYIFEGGKATCFA